jgi:intracellular septation protein
MADKPINPVLKQVLDLGPTLVFFVLYTWIKDDKFVVAGTTYSGFIVAAIALVPLISASILTLWYLTGKISRIQIFTAFMVLFFGGLTAWFNDERFFKIKTTIVWGSLSAVLWLGLARGKSFLEWALSEQIPMKSAGWMILTRRLALMLAAMALANEVIWRTQTTELWVKLETFALPGALMLFMFVQMLLLQAYIDEPPQDGA